MNAKPPAQHAVENYQVQNLGRPAGERWVTMSNALTRAGHGLTLSEKRIIACAISKLDSRKAYQPGMEATTRISAHEYAETFQVDLKTAYEQLQDAARQLYSRSITFYEPSSRRKGKDISLTKVQVRWVGMVKYQKGEGWVELEWFHKLLPQLVGLKKHFTSYQLAQASALRSTYSWRLLELLMRFEGTGWAEYTMEDFRVSMDAPPSLSDFAQVKRRIIEPAVKELTQKDGWRLSWKPIKAGRKVVAVRFEFKRDEQMRLF